MAGKHHSIRRIPHSKISRVVSALFEWYSDNARDLPWRRTRDPYAIWISEIMLQQTQVATVLPYWERWMDALPTLESLARTRSTQLHKLWEGLGYYRRVDHLHKAARILVQRHQGRFPRNFEDVIALPGIGRYTAGAICSIAFNQPTPILDGNVLRVLTRVFGIAGDPRDSNINRSLWQLSETLVQTAQLRSTQNSKLKTQNSNSACSDFNQSLMELGALICTPRRPDCAHCPVRRLCVAFRQHRVSDLPTRGRRSAPTARRFAAFVVQCDGRYLVRRRPAGVVNARLWEFPNVELTRDRTNLRAAARRVLGFRADAFVPLCTVKHSITRYRITLEAALVHISDGHGPNFASGNSSSRWLEFRDLVRLPFPSAHRKILNAVATVCANKCSCNSGQDR